MMRHFLIPQTVAPQTNTPNFANQSYDGNTLRALYGVPFVKPAAGSKVVVVAIIIGFHNSHLLEDLQTAWNKESSLGGGQGIPFPNVRVHTMANVTNPDKTTLEGWNTEASLDLQMVCHMNPYADIWVIESADVTNDALMAAIQYAEELNVDVISMSWGGRDNLYNKQYNKYFTKPTVCYCASSGDWNYVCWPSVVPNCLSIGGTSLVSTGSGASAVRTAEYTWPSAGCGYSTTCIQPGYQSRVLPSKAYRSSPDLSLVANPSTGVHVVDGEQTVVVGGTSVSCPIFAGMLSLAIQERYNRNPAAVPLTSVCGAATNVQECLYARQSTFYDVTVGVDGSFSAGNGFDTATGLGAPLWVTLIPLITL